MNFPFFPLFRRIRCVIQISSEFFLFSRFIHRYRRLFIIHTASAAAARTIAAAGPTAASAAAAARTSAELSTLCVAEFVVDDICTISQDKRHDNNIRQHDFPFLPTCPGLCKYPVGVSSNCDRRPDAACARPFKIFHSIQSNNPGRCLMQCSLILHKCLYYFILLSLLPVQNVWSKLSDPCRDPV